MRAARALAIALAVLAAAIAAPALAQTAPPAGTVIGNQATANYTDAGGASRTATSNLVQVTVTQVKSFTLAAPGAITAAGGTTVYYPHTITNTGNGVDTYTFNAVATGGGFTHAAPAYYADADGNGVPDNFSALASTGPIASGGVFRFVLAGGVPAAAAGVGTMVASVSDTSGGAALTNMDSTTVASSAIFVSKSLSVTSGASPNPGPITVTLSYNNTGSSAATNLLLRDTLPAGMTYVAGSGVWNGSLLLSDAPAGDPAGILYEFTAGQVIATIASVPAGAAGQLTFGVQIAAGRPPGLINNVASYQTSTQSLTNTNTAGYQVLRAAGVVANGSTSVATNGTGEPVTIPAAVGGSTIPFTNVIWNTGNEADSFSLSLAGQAGWPPGTTFALLQPDGVTPLIGNTTPPVPVYGGGCPAAFEADAANQRCGYRVILRVQLPVGAAGGPYSVTATASSVFDPSRTDTVIDTLAAVSGSTVDLTNNAALPTTPANGQGATGTTVITTNTVAPLVAGTTTTRFVLFVNNTGAIADTFSLAFSPPPAGWTVAFRDDGGLGTCATVGGTLTGTGPVNPGTARLVCAEATLPATPSGQVAPGNYDLDFTATSVLSSAVADVKRDRVTVSAVNGVTLAPDNALSVAPGGTVTYAHVLTNVGNAADTVSFAAGFLSDSRAAQGWTSVAYVDGNGNGTFDPGVDDVPANLVSAATTIPLALSATRSIFVRVAAPPGALASDPANVTTLTARFGGGASSVSATDTSLVSGGLVVAKDQQAVACATAAPHPAAGYSAAALPAGPSTAPGQCISYRIQVTNATAVPMTAVVVSDAIPANTTHRTSCGTGAAGAATDVGTVTAPANGAAGTVTANVGNLAAGQVATVTFCVRIDP
jgi:uncharacterized repeat protein (TIGR01451 family)